MSKMDNDVESALLPNDHLGTETTATSVASSADVSDDDGDGPKVMGMWDYVHTGVTGLLSIGGVATAAGAAVSSPGIAIFAASGFTAFNSPTIVYKQYKLTKAPGIRAHINLLKKDTNLLSKENDILTASVDDLEDEVEDIKEIEENLQAITTRQGANVNEFVRLVKENEEVLKGMRTYLRKLAIEDVTAIVVAADQDGDMTIDRKELHVLTLRIETKLEAHGIKLNSEKFEAEIRKRPSITNVLNVCKILLQNEMEGDDDDDSDDGSDDSRSTVEYGDDDSSGDESEDSDDDDAMFTLDDKFTGGSVEKARGNRMSLHHKTPPRKDKVQKIVARASKLSTADNIRMDDDDSTPKPRGGGLARSGWNTKGKDKSLRSVSMLKSGEGI